MPWFVFQGSLVPTAVGRAGQGQGQRCALAVLPSLTGFRRAARCSYSQSSARTGGRSGEGPKDARQHQLLLGGLLSLFSGKAPRWAGSQEAFPGPSERAGFRLPVEEPGVVAGCCVHMEGTTDGLGWESRQDGPSLSPSQPKSL